MQLMLQLIAPLAFTTLFTLLAIPHVFHHAIPINIRILGIIVVTIVTLHVLPAMDLPVSPVFHAQD